MILGTWSESAGLQRGGSDLVLAGGGAQEGPAR